MTEDERLKLAKRKIQERKGFYTHLIIYSFINVAYNLFNFGLLDGGKLRGIFPWWSSITLALGWGLCVAVHGLYSFYGERFFGFYKRWENLKIKEFMEKEEAERNYFSEE
ncbi:MAG: 2TM domain-containing protein [Leeuwenhoekiella sp.]